MVEIASTSNINVFAIITQKLGWIQGWFLQFAPDLSIHVGGYNKGVCHNQLTMLNLMIDSWKLIRTKQMEIGVNHTHTYLSYNILW